MNWKLIVFPIVGILVLGALLLPTNLNNPAPETDGSAATANTGADVPSWKVSEYWSFSAKGSNFEATELNLVCYDVNGGNYYIGTDSRNFALFHSVYNVLPMLGRQTVDNLDVYENGEPKSMYQFPLTDGAGWQSTLYEMELEVTVTEVSGEYNIVAEGANGFTLTYNYIPSVNWFSEFSMIDNGVEIISLELMDHGFDYTGSVYFMRASDLFESSGTTVDNFAVSGHAKYGDFDFLAMGITENNGPGFNTVILTDPWGNNHIRTDQINELPAVTGDWTIRAIQFASENIQVNIAGVIEYTSVL